jgi:hypothetical protein
LKYSTSVSPGQRSIRAYPEKYIAAWIPSKHGIRCRSSNAAHLATLPTVASRNCAPLRAGHGDCNCGQPEWVIVGLR